MTRDEHYDNQAYKDGLVRTHMLTLGVSLAAVLVLVVGVLAPPGAGPGANVSVVGAVRTGQLAGNVPVSPPGNASAVGAVRVGPPAGASVPGEPDVSPFAAVGLFGLLGGTVSAMIRAAEPGQSSRIPELTAAMRVTFLRVVMGGASALVLSVIRRSGIGSALGTQLSSKDIADAIKDLGGYTVYTVAFVAGFSERLVTRAVDKTVGSTDDKGKAREAG